MSGLRVLDVGPGVTVQDRGRPGWLAEGLSRGGAADGLALDEGAALLGQGRMLAALEMAGLGGRFEAEGDLRIALTGAPMRAAIEGSPVAWNACHALARGQELTIGAAEAGVYGYLHLGGGIAREPLLGSRSAHLTAGLFGPVAAGDRLPAGADPGGPVGLGLEPRPRFSGGRIRIVPSAQTGLFTAAERTRFAATDFVRDARGNRQGVRLAHEGAPFSAEGGLSILSEVVVPGDIQMTGDGIPYVLLPECQTMGGYPRIGTVVPDDLAQVAQAPAGARLRFDFVDPAEALAELRRTAAGRAADLRRRIRPLVRDPATIPDLLSYQLVSGVTAGHDAAEQEISGGTAK